MRLDFFKEFILSTGFRYNEIADMLGISTSAVWLWFAPKKDDVKLSNIRKVAEVTGYTAHVSMKKRVDVLSSSTDPKQESSYRYVDGQLVSDPLSFLDMFLEHYEITKKDLSEKLKYPYTTLLYWFREGDISVSKLYEIAEAYDAVLCFYFEKNLPEETERNIPTKDGAKVLTRITINKAF